MRRYVVLAVCVLAAVAACGGQDEKDESLPGNPFAHHEQYDGADPALVSAARGMATDPLITEVGWSWLTDALGDAGAEHTNAAGSITVVRSDGFGAMADDEGDAQIEVRASWTPHGGLQAHASAWMELLGKLAGLPPLAPGVVPLSRRRTGR